MVDATFVWITDLADADRARRAGAALLASGIVAEIDDTGAGVVGLRVMADDVQRACEILDLPVPDQPVVPPVELDEPVPRQRWSIPRDKVPLLVVAYLLALVVISVSVFFVTSWLTEDDVTGRTEVPSDEELEPLYPNSD